MTVYTGRGDSGNTDLIGGDRVPKTHPRIEAYGTVDELNALLGTCHPTDYDDLDGSLETIQQHLHIIQAMLANPDPTGDGPALTARHVTTLESWIDESESELAPLESFILPGGTTEGAALHHARTVCRRAERRVVALDGPDETDGSVRQYLNRLSDLLFVYARLANHRGGVSETTPSYSE